MSRPAPEPRERPERALPARWPSAWPALRRGVRDGVAGVLSCVLLSLGGTVWLGDPGRAWWVALLPLVLLVVPLSRPARTRAAFVRGRARGSLQLRRDHDGLVVTAGRRRAMVEADGAVRYFS